MVLMTWTPNKDSDQLADLHSLISWWRDDNEKLCPMRHHSHEKNFSSSKILTWGFICHFKSGALNAHPCRHFTALFRIFAIHMKLWVSTKCPENALNRPPVSTGWTGASVDVHVQMYIISQCSSYNYQNNRNNKSKQLFISIPLILKIRFSLPLLIYTPQASLKYAHHTDALVKQNTF